MARKRRFASLANELLKKAREAMLTAVQIFNNPHVEFKSELFIVTTIIAWTYLLHAYYRRKHIDYRITGRHLRLANCQHSKRVIAREKTCHGYLDSCSSERRAKQREFHRIVRGSECP